MTKSDNKPQSKGILFECRDSSAKHVFLAGTFNDWDVKATPMEMACDGTWRAHLDLRPGRYEYKFVIDDRWCCESGGDEQGLCDCVPNEFVSMNRVIEVPQR